MSLPLALFRLPGGQEVEVGPTGVVGRMVTAALCLDDPRVSEAHAMVGLRGGELVLLALRGGLTVGTNKVSRVTLERGQRIELVPGLVLTVADLVLPERMLGVSLDGGPPEPLVSSTYSVRSGRLEAGYHPDAAAHLWSGDGWRARVQGREARPLVAGDALDLGGHVLTAVDLPARAVGAATSRAPSDGLSLTIVTRGDSVHVGRADGKSVRVPGIPARILSELAAYAAPVSWEMVARTVWEAEDDRFVLRQNWDRHLKSLRARLREEGLRDDLVRPDGCGNVELFLRPGDRVLAEP